MGSSKHPSRVIIKRGLVNIPFFGNAKQKNKEEISKKDTLIAALQLKVIHLEAELLLKSMELEHHVTRLGRSQ